MKNQTELVVAVNIDMSRRTIPTSGAWLLPVTMVGEYGQKASHRLKLHAPKMNPLDEEFWVLAKQACLAFRRSPHWIVRTPGGSILMKQVQEEAA